MITSKIINVLLLLCSINAFAQSKIIKISYESKPVSQYMLRAKDRIASTSRPSKEEVLNSITFYNSLYINLEDRSSLYVLDSTVRATPESHKVSLAVKIFFSLKNAKNKTFKYETFMNQTFYSTGDVGDIDWELTKEEKVINGLKCFKAKAKEREWMLTAWYTKEIPVSNGPSIYQGLPGLVVWVEDFFRTIQITDVSYSDDTDAFQSRYKKLLEQFQKKENKKHSIKELLVIVDKSDFANSMFRFFHGKTY